MPTTISWKSTICQIPPPKTCVKKVNKYLQIPVNTFKFPQRCSDTMKCHQLLWNTFQNIKSSDIFISLQIPCLAGNLTRAWFGGGVDKSFRPHRSHQERSLAYSAFQVRLAATGLGEKGGPRGKRKVARSTLLCSPKISQNPPKKRVETHTQLSKE